MPRREPGRLHGYLVIDKPAGWTSHDVVARVRRITGEQKVGHAGTLDPAATGVLPIAIGQATRSLEFLAGSSKTYLAEITYGVRTDSYDSDGVVQTVGPLAGIDPSSLTNALRAITGKQLQVPPMFSAIKVGGRRLYDLARLGTTVERAPRQIEIHEICQVGWEPPLLTLCIDCSKGTYVRSIAHDLGERAGCGAHLSNLVRLRTGPFTLADAWTIDELTQLDLAEIWESVAVHPDVALHDMPGIVLDGAAATDWRYGRSVPASDLPDAWARVYDGAGNWLGIANADAATVTWRPHKVVGEAA